VGDFELLLCHGTVCVVGKIRDLILQLSKSSIYSTKPNFVSKSISSQRAKRSSCVRTPVNIMI
ncbi:PTS fructose IIA subunit, partial [Escherichia coli]